MTEVPESKSVFVEPRYVRDLDGCFFYHTMELPGFGEVKGQWDLRGRFDEYIGGVEVAGKSVLDIGSATGFLSFEAEKRGASRVVPLALILRGARSPGSRPPWGCAAVGDRHA